MAAPYLPDEWLDALGVALREARAKSGKSQLDLGLDVARPGRDPVHRNYISGIECGRRSPTVKIMVELVNELDGDVAGLFERAAELLARANTGTPPGRPDARRAPLHYKDDP